MLYNTSLPHEPNADVNKHCGSQDRGVQVCSPIALLYQKVQLDFAKFFQKILKKEWIADAIHSFLYLMLFC